MHHALEFKGVERKEEAQPLVEDLMRRIERKLQAFPPDALFLRFVADATPAHSLFRVTVTLTIPGEVLSAKKESHDLTAAVRAVFAEIDREVEAYKAAFRGEQWWKRLARRYELHWQTAAPAAEEPSAGGERQRAANEEEPAFEKSEASRFFRLVSPHIQKLRDFVRHVLIHAQARGDLAPGEEEPALSEDILDFYQPDEDLKPEDAIPDIEAPSPEDELERVELRKCVRAALKALPKEHRRALILRYVLGLSGRALEQAVSRPRQEVERWLTEGRESLRKELAAAGCSFREAGDETSMLAKPGSALKGS
jgi:ribosome-associated translation inhibitor RaiA